MWGWVGDGVRRVGAVLVRLWHSFSRSYSPPNVVASTLESAIDAVCKGGKLLILQLQSAAPLPFELDSEKFEVCCVAFNAPGAYRILRDVPVGRLPQTLIADCRGRDNVMVIDVLTTADRANRIFGRMRRELVGRRRKFTASSVRRSQDEEFEALEAEQRRIDAEEREARLREIRAREDAIRRQREVPAEPEPGDDVAVVQYSMPDGAVRRRRFSLGEPSAHLYDLLGADFDLKRLVLLFGFPHRRWRRDDLVGTFRDIGLSKREVVRVELE